MKRWQIPLAGPYAKAGQQGSTAKPVSLTEMAGEFQSITAHLPSAGLTAASREQSWCFAISVKSAKPRQKKKAADDLARHSALLERKNAELEQFAYAASHDLREPLRTISAYAELMRRDKDCTHSEKCLSYLGSVISAVRRMDQLIDALLQYSKAGESDGDAFHVVQIDQVVNATIESLNGSIAANQAVITRDTLPAIARR